MKKIAFLTISLVFLLAMMVSCNKDVCPAYAAEPDTEQVEILA